MVEYVGSSENAQDIVECVSTILETPYGMMPYMREMGITSDVIGRSSSETEGEYFNQAVEQVETWDERASVSEIVFGTAENIKPKVVIEDGE